MYQKSWSYMLYCSWDMTHDVCNCYFSFWVIFLTFNPSNNPKNKNFKKMKKHLKISSFYTSVPKIIYYTVPEIWHMTDVIVTFHLRLFFCLFTPLAAQKIKISEKWKKSLEISFYTCVPKITIRWCTVPEIWCVTDRRTNGQTEKVTDRGGCPT